MDIEKIRKGIGQKQQMFWPGTQEKVFIRVLSKQEMQDARFAARHHFSQHNIEIDAASAAAYIDEENVQILFRALSDEEGKPVVQSADVLRGLLTMDAQNAFTDAYAAHEAEVAPDFGAMDDQQFNELLADLKKNADPIIGSVSSIALARRLLRSLVSLQQS